MQYFYIFTHVIFTLTLGYYFISSMQWYSYKIDRVVLHFNRYDWHLYFFVVPVFMYYLSGMYFTFYLYLLLLPTMYFWYRKLDKKLVFTPRVKRFFVFLILAIVFQDLLCIVSQKCVVYGVIMPLFFSYLASYIYEKILFINFKKRAKAKLNASKNLKIIAITASYGKTSIKNFLYEVLSTKYSVYKTPRSINTLAGIIKDINENLNDKYAFYIVEAGARQRGDIDEIAKFVNPHVAIVGQIGKQHIEYFKSLENIRNTKMELLNSSRLEKSFIHTSANVKKDKNMDIFGNNIRDLNATLDGISFSMKTSKEIGKFHTKLLGSFNANNLEVVILVALYLGIDIYAIKNSIKNLQGVEHRLQKIETNGKIIIDDSYNGNLQGMLSSYELISSYEKRRVIVTPGIVESSEKANEELAKKIDDIFDLVIITGKTNQKILNKNIKKAEKIILKDKDKLQIILAENTIIGDLILFSNDAPAFM
ncbi:MAG: UDP-N-acetylmuramoyl-tripeptide--D-alanyl-D-alanine ligase [Campylobacteraceae bacterium]|nr:UDP-N-acetylmuramoyl-tripeptide--D-alanyl-D-alanine ligase [Campylobacteraceae bacterium]